MSAEIVNLRRRRKAKQRAGEADAAAQNRLSFGRSKQQRAFASKIETLEQRQFEAHRLSPKGSEITHAEDSPVRDHSAEDAADGA